MIAENNTYQILRELTANIKIELEKFLQIGTIKIRK